MRSHVYDFITYSATGPRKFKGQWATQLGGTESNKSLFEVPFLMKYYW